MQNKRFTKRKESFECQNCGCFVDGNGFTNHCPQCLWSRHVDVNPGDRLADCHGMMEPIAIERSAAGDFVLQQCLKCGFRRRNSISSNDNFEAVLCVSASAK